MELFYAFKDFKSIKQDRSKLCWAACIEMILTSIDTHHLEDEFQINAAKKYKSIFNISNILPVNDDNVEIREDHLKTMFNHYNIKLNEFHCNVYNFDFYKLEKSLKPGDTLGLAFTVKNKPNTILRNNSSVVYNGTFINNFTLFPSLGYSGGEL